MGKIKVDMLYRPQLVFEIHAQQPTLSSIYNLGRGEAGGLSLRFPSFKAIRTDKGVSEATTGEEILELAKGFELI
jgi:ATP-dependent DNA ligase